MDKKSDEKLWPLVRKLKKPLTKAIRGHLLLDLVKMYEETKNLKVKAFIEWLISESQEKPTLLNDDTIPEIDDQLSGLLTGALKIQIFLESAVVSSTLEFILHFQIA